MKDAEGSINHGSGLGRGKVRGGFVPREMDLLERKLIRHGLGNYSAHRKRKGPNWVDLLLAASMIGIVIWLGFRAACAV